MLMPLPKIRETRNHTFLAASSQNPKEPETRTLDDFVGLTTLAVLGDGGSTHSGLTASRKERLLSV